MLTKFRYYLSFMANGFTYANSINDYFLDYYLGHHKIIGWYNGLPVYSSFLTPGFSKPLANLLAKRLISGLIEMPLPGMVNISVTDSCNAKCRHCSFYNAMDKKNKKVLSTNEMKEVIKECQDFGICIINFVGGEPLMREDICEVVASVDKNKSISSMFTNGWFLKEKAKGLKKAGLMMVNVSLDSTDSRTHDEFRRLSGLFKRAIEGIKECQKVGLLTAISMTVTQEDIESGNLEKMILFGKKIGVNEIFILDTLPVGMYSHRKNTSNKLINLKKLYTIVNKYNKLKGFPGIFSYSKFKEQSSFGCSAGRNYFYVGPYGDVYPCDFTAKPIGNLNTERLAKIWFRLVENRKSLPGKYMNDCCDLTKR